MTSRRNVLRAAAITPAAAALSPAPATASAAGAEFGPVSVRPDDPRYADLVRRGNNRFVGRPDEVRVVGSTEQVVAAVRDAVRSGRRLAVRSGGHCFEGFVDDPAVRLVIDLSGLNGIRYDRVRDAYVVEAGATLGEIYRRLYLGWGVTVPGGECPGVGIGGHAAGGGYGRLSRLHGLVSDHVYAVEVVVVDQAGRAHAVVATSDRRDPNRDLWWAHAGGGGGSFGVVTRYWFRDLPQPPREMLRFSVEWPWEGLDETGFRRLAANAADWAARHSAPGAREAQLYSELVLTHRSQGAHLMIGDVAGGDQALFTAYLGALREGVGVTPSVTQKIQPWLRATLGETTDDGKQWRLKVKSGYHRGPLTDHQLAAAYHHLTRPDFTGPVGSVSLNLYGGAINAVAPEATAIAHRGATMLLFYLTAWNDPAADDAHLAWIREFYADVYAESGGVPAGGAYISYPDIDQPRLELYFGSNLERLRQVKAKWDPRNVFRHALSVSAK
ncbi:FAD-binding protein [Kribbella sp. NPDC050459]|uniref:FAD-binding oxidoreductase n=1 Tax=Kribbella sp. NPDC050459 TaxID=3155785 RepID=UPI003404CEAF